MARPSRQSPAAAGKPRPGTFASAPSAVPLRADQALYLIDVSSYIFRAYHALPPLTTRSGVPTGAVYGLTTMILKLLREERPAFLAVVEDRGQSGRQTLFSGYKADRVQAPDDLRLQLPLVRRVLEAFDLPRLGVEGCEADDSIATLTRQALALGVEVVIVSIDKDLLQLVSDRVQLYDTMRERRLGPDEVRARYGVGPEQLGDVLALMGDSIDSIPGVPGIGEKTASQLIGEHGNLETLLSKIDTVKGEKRRQSLRDHAEAARLSRRLVALQDDLPLALDLSVLGRRDPEPARLEPLFRELEFVRLVTSLIPRTAVDRNAYHTVLDEPELATALAAHRAAGEIGFKVLLDRPDPARGSITGFALASRSREGTGRVDYLPVGHRGLLLPAQLTLPRLLEALGPLLVDETLAKHVHAVKEDLVVLTRHGRELRGIRSDPMLASYVLDPSVGSHSLPELAREHLEHTTLVWAEVCKREKKAVGFDEVDLGPATAYAGEVAECALLLGQRLHPRLAEAGLASLMDDVELPLARVLARMEAVGMGIDVEILAALDRTATAELAVLEQDIHALAGWQFNILSTPQLRELLFERLALKPKRRTKTGYSTDEDTLEELAKLHPLPRKVLDYRHLVKLKNTYLEALPRLIHPETGRIHTSYGQAVAATGRLSSSEPNLQNIPIRTELGQKIRRAFVPAAGRVMLSADYSQVELRVLAHLSQDEVLLDAFARDQDVHRRTAAEVFGKSPEEVTPQDRNTAKAINFGIIYGQEAFGLSQTLGIAREEAAEYIRRYRERLAGVERFMANVIEEAKGGQPVRTVLGRRRYLPDLRSSNPRSRNAAERIARNTPIQGSAADILKLAMVAIDRRLHQEQWPAIMVCTVHDELVFEVTPERVEALGTMVRGEMEDAGRRAGVTVHLRVDVGHGQSWADAH